MSEQEKKWQRIYDLLNAETTRSAKLCKRFCFLSIFFCCLFFKIKLNLVLLESRW